MLKDQILIGFQYINLNDIKIYSIVEKIFTIGNQKSNNLLKNIYQDFEPFKDFIRYIINHSNESIPDLSI